MHHRQTRNVPAAIVKLGIVACGAAAVVASCSGGDAASEAAAVVADAPSAVAVQEAPSDDAPASLSSDQVTVLYLGHSFGRPFAEQMESFAALAAVGHRQQIVTRGGRFGAPQALWEAPAERVAIEERLETGEIDVVIMICCSEEFVESRGASDQAITDITAYALEYNPETRIGLALPWADFPQDYGDADEHRLATDAAYPLWQNLASDLSATFSDLDVFTIYHGAAVYELRDRYEQGMLDEVDQLTGPRRSSVFTDEKGHAGEMAVDLGSLLWFHAIHGVDVATFPEFDEYELDIREVAREILEEQGVA